MANDRQWMFLACRLPAAVLGIPSLVLLLALSASCTRPCPQAGSRAASRVAAKRKDPLVAAVPATDRARRHPRRARVSCGARAKMTALDSPTVHQKCDRRQVSHGCDSAALERAKPCATQHLPAARPAARRLRPARSGPTRKRPAPCGAGLGAGAASGEAGARSAAARQGRRGQKVKRSVAA